MGPVEKAQALKKELLNRLLVLGPYLPNNMLDELIDALGGTENVAEVRSVWICSTIIMFKLWRHNDRWLEGKVE